MFVFIQKESEKRVGLYKYLKISSSLEKYLNSIFLCNHCEQADIHCLARPARYVLHTCIECVLVLFMNVTLKLHNECMRLHKRAEHTLQSDHQVNFYHFHPTFLLWTFEITETKTH